MRIRRHRLSSTDDPDLAMAMSGKSGADELTP